MGLQKINCLFILHLQESCPNYVWFRTSVWLLITFQCPEVDENDEESEGEWEDGAEEIIANDMDMDHSARDFESRRRLDEIMNKVGQILYQQIFFPFSSHTRS